SGLEEMDREVPPEPREVEVRREDWSSEPFGDRTDQEVHRGAGDSAGAAAVEVFGRADVIGRADRLVRESRKGVAKAFERPPVGDSRKRLLPDDAEKENSPVADELAPRLDQTLLGRTPDRGTPAKGERPDRRIDENVHRRRRAALWSYPGA